ncbi:hypothetical protein [Psychromicrobium sp. YIM B11713]|uniref:hypothetical protein n=1 Tax=Psychromicrobium sp. YIM B11713 TaxID=3145233 RepID=UPI00374FD734
MPDKAELDEIGQLISSADPMRGTRQRIPDAEMELRRVVSESPSRPQKIVGAASPAVRSARRMRWARISVLAPLAVLAVVALSAVFLNLGNLTHQPAAGPLPALQNPGWQQYLESSGQLSFEYPSGWKVREKPSTNQDGGQSRTMEVRTPADQVMAVLTLEKGVAFPELCQLSQGAVVLDSVAMPLPKKNSQPVDLLPGEPSFVFRVSPEANSSGAHSPDTVPPTQLHGTMLLRNQSSTPNTGGCLSPDRIYGPDGVTLVGFGNGVSAGRLDASAPLAFKDLATAQDFLKSEQYQVLKKILTSLRFR